MKVNSSWRIRFIQKLNELLHRRQLLLRDPQLPACFSRGWRVPIPMRAF
jgi:hypothetical protein